MELKFKYISRPLRALSYSTRWIGTKKALEINEPVNFLRTRLATGRVLYRTGLAIYQPRATFRECTSDWIAIADTIHLLSSRVKNYNHYHMISSWNSFQVVVISGSIAKMASSAYKICYYDLSVLGKCKHSILVIRKVYYLYGKVSGNIHPTFHLTLLTLSFICEVAIDAQNLTR